MVAVLKCEMEPRLSGAVKADGPRTSHEDGLLLVGPPILAEPMVCSVFSNGVVHGPMTHARAMKVLMPTLRFVARASRRAVSTFLSAVTRNQCVIPYFRRSGQPTTPRAAPPSDPASPPSAPAEIPPQLPPSPTPPPPAKASKDRWA